MKLIFLLILLIGSVSPCLSQVPEILEITILMHQDNWEQGLIMDDLKFNLELEGYSVEVIKAYGSQYTDTILNGLWDAAVMTINQPSFIPDPLFYSSENPLSTVIYHQTESNDSFVSGISERYDESSLQIYQKEFFNSIFWELPLFTFPQYRSTISTTDFHLENQSVLEAISRSNLESVYLAIPMRNTLLFDLPVFGFSKEDLTNRPLIEIDEQEHMRYQGAEMVLQREITNETEYSFMIRSGEFYNDSQTQVITAADYAFTAQLLGLQHVRDYLRPLDKSLGKYRDDLFSRIKSVDFTDSWLNITIHNPKVYDKYLLYNLIPTPNNLLNKTLTSQQGSLFQALSDVTNPLDSVEFTSYFSNPWSSTEYILQETRDIGQFGVSEFVSTNSSHPTLILLEYVEAPEETIEYGFTPDIVFANSISWTEKLNYDTIHSPSSRYLSVIFNPNMDLAMRRSIGQNINRDLIHRFLGNNYDHMKSPVSPRFQWYTGEFSIPYIQNEVATALQTSTSNNKSPINPSSTIMIFVLWSRKRSKATKDNRV